ncbi:MAG TPA: PhpK family radical SAM P-methyltransferase [Pyrinomonadaceae bacterium]
MSDTSKLDCVIVGYNDLDFGHTLKAQKLGEKYSGGYRSSKINSLIYRGERITYTNLLNQVLTKATGVDPELNVFKLPNLAVCYLKSYLSRRGLNVEIINFYNSEKDRFAELLAQSPNAVAITTTYYVDDEPIADLVEFIRQHCPETKIIVGGPHIFNLHTHHDAATQEFLWKKLGADVYVYDSQGEATLNQVLHQLRDEPEKSLGDVPNLIYTTDGVKFEKTAKAIESNDLDENILDWSFFEQSFITPTVSMRTARSCAFKCSFCSYPFLAGELTLTGLDAVEKEMRYLKGHGVKNLIFIDDTFNIPLPRFKDLCRMMIKNKFDFNWYSMYRCSNSDDEAFELLAESGCKGVFLGIESGSNTILKNMNKAAKKERYMDGIAKLQKNGVTTLASFIVGFPGETDETVQETIDFIEQTSPTFYRAQLYYHDIKVPIHNEAKKYGLTGAGYSWKHQTMDWQQAADWIEVMYRKITNSSVFPLHGFDLESIAYLVGAGIDLGQIKGFASIAQEMLVQSLNDEHRDTSAQERRLIELFQPVTV